MINVEIVYAQTQRAIAKSLKVPQGARIADALALAAADQEFLGVDLGRAVVGIFGKVAARDQLLKEGDRIEIYRPLLEEPKLARRKRASRKASKPGRS
jgi:putative ubiquitin-RnfH superfamily antitoxin RatB of RatAB toxin-antitoxin module